MDPTNVVGRRIAAWITDGILDTVALLALVQLVGVELERRATTGTLYDVRPEDGGAWTLVLLGYVAWLAVKVALVSSRGWTPGKLLWGIRVAGWDGRPPGLARGLARGAVVGVLGALAGCLYWLVGLACVALSNGHRQPADWVAGTWVIDADYQGRLILPGDRHPVAGPPSMTREEAAGLLESDGVDAAAVLAPGPKSTEPFYDRTRDTYVVWNERQTRWLQFDKPTNAWVPLR